MDPAEIQKPYYPALDGLRGLAILLVVVYHNFGFIDYFFFGWLGVDLFFVLSGFLITDILLRSLGQKNFLKNFYMRRILRIFPLYYLTLIFFLLIYPRLFDNPDLSYYTTNQVWLWGYLQNWLYIFKPDQSANILHHLWSLAVEEQFYLVWPFLILLIKKPKRLIILLAIVLALVISLRLIVWLYQIESLAYFNLYTFSRIDGICIGSILALLCREKPDFLNKYFSVIVFSMAGLNFLFYFLNQWQRFTLPYLAIAGYTTFAILLSLLVYEGIKGNNKLVNFLFTNGFMKFFGKISYGLYVFHWPIYLIFTPLILPLFEKTRTTMTAHFLNSFSCIIIAVGISWLSLNYFESFFLKLKKSFV